VASVKEHYENLLAPYYTWICGGSDSNFKENLSFFNEHGVRPVRSGIALDLGAGTGFQSIPLAESGFHVFSIDLNHELLAQLKKDAKNMPVVTIQDNLLNFNRHISSKVEIIVCMGDTLTHLDSLEQVQGLIENVHQALEKGGLFILGFRDMTIELTELDRFIPVRSDEKRIFTCFLEFEGQYVKIHDVIYEKTDDHWNMKKSFFRKLRISQQWMKECLQKAGFRVESNSMTNGMVTLLALKL
jgi:SAM-dependent methyltransferase